MNDTIYLVDAYAQIYRCYFAVRGLTTSTGKPTNAIFGMGRFLLTLEKEFLPDIGAFAFDLGAPVKRLEITPDYKANRPSMSDDMKEQIEAIREMIVAAGWRIFEKEGNEADDVIATLTCKFRDNPVKIISNDKDIAQLVDERVQMYATAPGSKGFILRDIQNIRDKFDINPSQMVDYLSIIGDNSDNIPGVPGVGPKTAAKLLNEFGSIDEIITRVDEIAKDSLKGKVNMFKDIMLKNRRLIALDTSIELDDCQALDNLNINLPNIEKLLEIADRYELKSLAKEFAKVYEKRLNPTLFDL